MDTSNNLKTSPMGGTQVITRPWKEWSLQALVLVSFMLQVALLILAEFRRYMNSSLLRFFVWSAYMAADATAIFVLGHLSVTTRSPEHELMSLWAPFLLLHLGGQDNITAYAIEDNKLWLRHLQTLSVQVVGAVYVIYVSSVIAGSSSSLPLLLPATILMFMVGVVKYGERVWALRCASSKPTGNYQSDIGKRKFYQTVPESLTSLWDEAEASLLHGHLLLDFAKDRFKGPLPRLFLCTPSSLGSQVRGEEELYKVAEMQLSLLHDVFYTKAEVTHTWYGICIRLLSTLATVVAFLQFNMVILGHRHLKLRDSYSRIDVILTNILFAGAVILEAMSLLRVMFSSWTCALMLKYGSKGRFLSPAVNSIARVPVSLRRLVRAAEWRRRCSWSRCMGQLNLVQLCLRSRASRYRKMARWVGAEDWWSTVFYSGPSIPISASVQKLLLESLKARPWGRVEFESTGLSEHLAWVADSMLEVRILIWHIATEIYLWRYNMDDGENEDNDADGGADLVDTAQVLSNYMLFLLAARPHMLQPGASRNDYLVLCYALIYHLRYETAEDLISLLQRYGDALRSNYDAPEFKLDCIDTNRLGDKVLKGGCLLGAFLIDREDRSSPVGGGGTLEMICKVWAQMLCGVADECSADSHTKQLSGGGELLTVAALVAKYMRSRRLSAYMDIDSKRRSEW